QETIEPAPIPAFRDPVRTRATAARSQPTGRQAGDDLRVDNTSESTAGAQDGWPIDPGVASAGDVVVYSGNTFIEVSTKSGAPGTFTHISIQSLTTDTPDLGYNGDQDIVYDPNTGTFTLIDQTHCLLGGALCQTPPAGATAAQTQNRYRLFV